MPAKTVLWVDDEAELLEPHRLFLKEKGYDVQLATNADDAVELLRRRPYDLVLLDEQMPGTRGLDALGEMREVAFQPARRHFGCRLLHIAPDRLQKGSCAINICASAAP